MTTSNTHWRVPKRWLPLLSAAVIAEAVSNALRAYSLGTHLEHFTLSIAGYPVSIAGAVLVLAAIAVAGSQARAAWVAFTPTSPARVRIVAGVVGLLLGAVSVTAMASHLLEANRAKVAGEGDDRGTFDRAQKAYNDLVAEFNGLVVDDVNGKPIPPRPVGVITADIAAVKIDMRIWNKSDKCNDITLPASKEACAPVLALYKERGTAASRAELSPKVDAAKAALDALRRPAEASAIEAQTAGVWGWLMGFAVVFLATFGSVLFAQVETVDQAPADRPAEPSAGDSAQTAFDPAGAAGLSGMFGPLPDRPAIAKPNRPENRRRGGSAIRPRRPNSSPDGSAGRRFARSEVLASLQSQLAAGEQFESQFRMSERFGVPTSTLSEWLNDWEAAGEIPARRTVGRCKALAGE